MQRFVKTILAGAVLACAVQAYAAADVKPAPTSTTTSTPTPTLAAATPAATPTITAPAVLPEEKAKIESVVRQYLMQNPEIIIEAVQNYQRKQYEQAEQTIKKTQQSAGTFAEPLFRQANDPVAGNPNGKVTVVEFFDYQCPHCVEMAPVVAAIIKANPDVRIVFKEFPIRGPVSDFASRAALAANKQGKYYEFSHNLLLAAKEQQPLTQEKILQVAEKSGLDMTKLKADMEDAVIKNQIKANTKLAQDLKLFGTPAFFIGKTDAKSSDKIDYVPGRMDQNQLQGEIDKAKS